MADSRLIEKLSLACISTASSFGSSYASAPPATAVRKRRLRLYKHVDTKPEPGHTVGTLHLHTWLPLFTGSYGCLVLLCSSIVFHRERERLPGSACPTACFFPRALCTTMTRTKTGVTYSGRHAQQILLVSARRRRQDTHHNLASTATGT